VKTARLLLSVKRKNKILPITGTSGNGRNFWLFFSFDIKYCVVGDVQYFFDQNNFIRIQMALSDFDFCNGTSGNITAVQLQFGCQKLLGHPCFLTQAANIFPDLFFNFSVQCFFLSVYRCSLTMDCTRMSAKCR